LVGHSYGGPIVSAVCDRLRERVAHAIYLDALTPKDGETIFPGGSVEAVLARYGELKDGYLAEPGDPAGFGVTDATPDLKAWVSRHLTPHLLGTWIQPVRLPNGGSDGLPRTFIFCSGKPAVAASAQARLDAFKADPSWGYAELPTGHDSMVTMPRETAELFVSIADGAITDGQRRAG
ncbi:MAG: alpha/beta hydrolase, partial [Rhodobacteraceae bacterium]|nr:alpha/beta hydrolase [Paracoccaceae bacterium]